MQAEEELERLLAVPAAPKLSADDTIVEVEDAKIGAEDDAVEASLLAELDAVDIDSGAQLRAMVALETDAHTSLTDDLDLLLFAKDEQLDAVHEFAENDHVVQRLEYEAVSTVEEEALLAELSSIESALYAETSTEDRLQEELQRLPTIGTADSQIADQGDYVGVDLAEDFVDVLESLDLNTGEISAIARQPHSNKCHAERKLRDVASPVVVAPCSPAIMNSTT
eukprot:SAG31_NODE_2375_length_5842_cov_1.832318_4_plen_224_part_00